MSLPSTTHLGVALQIDASPGAITNSSTVTFQFSSNTSDADFSCTLAADGTSAVWLIDLRPYLSLLLVLQERPTGRLKACELHRIMH